MRESGTLEALARAVGEALRPLETQLGAPKVDGFFRSLGLGLPEGFVAQPPLAASLAAVSAGAAGLSAPLTALANALASGHAPQITAAGVTVLQRITAVLQGMPQIGIGVQQVALTFPGLSPAQRTALGGFGADFSGRIVQHLLVNWMESKSAALLPALGLTALLDDQPEPGDPFDPFKPAFRRRNLRFDLLGNWFSNPTAFLQATVGLGRPDFDGIDLFKRIKNYLDQAELPAVIISAPGFPNILDAGIFRLGVEPATSPPSLSFRLRIPSVRDYANVTPLNPRWSLRLTTGGRWNGGLEGRIGTDGSVALHPTAGGTASLNVSIVLEADAGADGFMLLGQAGASQLSLQSVSLRAGIDAAWNGTDATGTPALGIALAGGKAVIDTSGGDSFLRFLTGGVRGEGSFCVSGSWTPQSGLRLDGSSGLEIALPMHAAIGPARLDTVYLRAGVAADGSIPVEISAAIAAHLGPLQVSVDRVGVIARARFPKTGGNLGPLDLGFEFKPPNGVGLLLEGGGFKGGGFLYLDPAKGEYGGALELEFQSLVSVKGVGILNTHMPDGSSGFSLLIIISAEFVPIQLGFGFTLIGVGGLIGLNRTVLFDPLRAGVRDGSLNSVLFPQDVVANAPRIIGDLRRIFPPQEDRVLIGPMVKFGWGTPTLMSAEFGLLLEIPRPGFAILGVLRVAIPAEEAPLIRLQVNFLGIVDFDAGQLSFDASLYDSYMLTFTLTGDMALRLYWGEDANFLLTVGGFHPAYTPPPMGLAPMRRLAIDMFTGMPRIRAEAYFAITSNTVQFGARVELYAGVDIFYVYGFMALDVLVQFSPVHFIAEMSAMLAVKSGDTTLLGVRVDALLEGPAAWHAHGTGTFEIGFIITVSFSVDFDVRVGEERKATLPPIEVLPLLRAALENKGNWRVVLPREGRPSVNLRELPEAGDALILHPFGGLEVSQKLVPLNLPINRFGSHKPSDGGKFRISKLAFGSEEIAGEATREQFAPAQFLEMSDAEKLSRRSFERYEAGTRVAGGDRAKTGYYAALDVVYEVIYLPAKRKGRFFRLGQLLMRSLLKASAVSQSDLSYAKRSPSPLGAPRTQMKQEQFAVAATRDLGLYAKEMVYASQAEAQAALQETLARSPDLARELQVVPLYQVMQQ
jgi:hypothetical protein